MVTGCPSQISVDIKDICFKKGSERLDLVAYATALRRQRLEDCCQVEISQARLYSKTPVQKTNQPKQDSELNVEGVGGKWQLIPLYWCV